MHQLISIRFLFYLNVTRNIQGQIMVASRLSSTEAYKRQPKTGFINRADIQVIGSSCQGNTPSLLVNSEGNSYLFNCCEGFQRNCYSNRIRLINLNHLFITRLHWPSVSGAYGLSLTLRDVGLKNFTIHSTENISDFFKSTQEFMSFTTGMECTSKDCGGTELDDSSFRVKCIPLDSKIHQDQDGIPTKKSRKVPTLVAFHCSLPDLPGRLDPKRCRELRVPIGPKLAVLKSGRDVTLDDGTIIKSSDVCGPASVGPNFIVIDCPTLPDIELVTQNHDLSRLQRLRSQGDKRQVDLVIHFSPEAITNDVRYRQWMDEFATECKHIMLVNSEFLRGNFIDAYRLQYLLGKIEPELFPALDMPAKLSKMVEAEIEENMQNSSENEFPDSDETELKTISKGDLADQDRVINASTFDRFSLRPNMIYEAIDPRASVDALYRTARLEPDYEEAYSEYKQATQNLPAPQAHEPEVVFLGTGSAVPSKLRNTTCILVNIFLPKKATIILDCGEDSYGQIVRHYGPDGAQQILENLKMIYVSHHHPDHHIGLIELLRRRKETNPSSVLKLLIPPGIDTHLNYYNKSFEDLSSTYSIICTKDLRTRPGAMSNSVIEGLCESLDGLLKSISIVNVEHCANACAVVLDLNIGRPGMNSFRLAYSGDARPSQDFAKIGHGCDLLIHEATFDHKETGAALEKKHSTTVEAIEQAKQMRAKFTILTHFSQRYAKIPYFTEEFDDSIGFAFDNMAVRCPSHFARIPLMKKLLSVIFAKSLGEISDKHTKEEYKREMLTRHN